MNNSFKEIESILKNYYLTRKIDEINLNIKELICYWKIGKILNDLGFYYDTWVKKYYLILSDIFDADVEDLDAMRQLFKKYPNMLDLPADISWKQLKKKLMRKKEREK